MEKNKVKFLGVFKLKKRRTMFIITFFTAIILTASTYAWLSSALNVKINFFQLSVSSNTGLFISLDGIDFSDSVNISMDSIIMDLKQTYPNHTNQWSYALWPVSSNGIASPNHDKFDIFYGELVRTRERNPNGTAKRLLNVVRANENRPNSANYFIAFDIFLKNVSGSPEEDNLYFHETTMIDYRDGVSDEIKEAMGGIINSLRIGIVRIGDVPRDSSIDDIQNVKCNNKCKTVIYEPNSNSHTKKSIEDAKDYGITLIDGKYVATYGMIKEGTRLDHTNGHAGTGIPLNSTNFREQETIKDFKNSIFEVPNAITKARVYIWLEGQDVDSLETHSKGTDLDVIINLEKDLAGYNV